jgi:hypothetical protein
MCGKKQNRKRQGGFRLAPRTMLIGLCFDKTPALRYCIPVACPFYEGLTTNNRTVIPKSRNTEVYNAHASQLLRAIYHLNLYKVLGAKRWSHGRLGAQTPIPEGPP